MAAVNSIQGELRLPLTGIAPPRLLMCSASMGAEGSVTLQLREAVQAPNAGSQLDTASLTIGCPDSNILANMLGTIQAADLYNNSESSSNPNINNNNSNDNNNNNNLNNNNNIENDNKINNDTDNKNNNDKNKNSKATSNNNNSIKNSNNNSINNENEVTTIPTQNSIITVKKSRPKTSSPTRHGPQQCQVCSKIFGNASALAKHKLTHSDERKYVCSMCSKAFKRQDHLNGHMLTHRNKKPYECKAEGCGKSYCDARSLRRHTENHHSSLAMTPTTPNQTLSSTGPPTGLSLSPATASGDASSPHGANCVQFNGNVGDRSSRPSLSNSPANSGNEGLTRQQLDLISQIMQQTKQANANFTNGTTAHRQIQRPRTWNMQTQLQQNNTKLSPNSDNLNVLSSISSSSTLTSSTTSTLASNIQTAPKIEQKPVECNLCHRKFKNIPALNGHMRLHGGYFKKDAETKKCDKKESNGPPLQTASIGIRALIEEKIISKRGKDLKGAFVVPAPPLTIRRTSDLDNFVAPKTPTIVNTPIQATVVTSNTSQTPTIATVGNIATTVQLPAHVHKHQTIETKDATLIELLKRGTLTSGDTANQIKFTSSGFPTQTTAVLLPRHTTVSTPITPTSTPPLAISLSGNNVKTTPLALTISQTPNETGDLYTLAYSTDAPTGFFSENDVYNVPDTAMLLQAVDSIQLLQNSTTNGQLDQLTSIGDYTLTENGDLHDSTAILTTRYTPSRQLQAVLNSPLPESLAEFSALHSKDYVLYGYSNTESPTTQSSSSPLPSPLSYPTPPASHEGVTQSSPFLDDSHHFTDAGSFFDDKKNITFLEENGGQFFKDPKDAELTDNERILKLKNELFNDSKSVMEESLFLKSEGKNVYHLKSSGILTEANHHDQSIADFNQNLSFLDEPQNFLDDARNISSPLSAAFFTGTMSSAEEVKEALEEVLPNENIPSEQSNDIDLYYLPLQSQMMLNSDDPLLSSSPKDFANKQQTHKFDFNTFSAPCAKKPKLDTNEIEEEKPETILTEQIPSELFLNPSSLSNIPPASSPVKQLLPKETHSSVILKKRQHTNMVNSAARKELLYRSNLRKTPASHYTPSPMLNPKRYSPGLYATVTKDLLEDIIDFDFTENSCMPEFLEKSKVNIGSDFQAVIPPFHCSDKNAYNVSADMLQWQPDILENERQLLRFIDLAKSSAVPLGSHSEEIALKTLQDAQGEVYIAILAMLQIPPSPIHKRWSHQEIEAFLKGLEHNGKDFYKIAKEIPNKSTGDCVQFYYFWKKLCIDYKVSHLNNELTAIEDINIVQIQPGNVLQESKPHVCEMPDCSASFTSKAALHGHTRIHCIARNLNTLQMNGHNGTATQTSGTIQSSVTTKDEFPCKVCGKVFTKVKSRSAHMKSHRPQESDATATQNS